jgi:hypothetical protein
LILSAEIVSISAPTPCSAQKSSISRVSAMPPIMDPVIERPLVSSEKAFSDKGFRGCPDVDQHPVGAQ